MKMLLPSGAEAMRVLELEVFDQDLCFALGESTPFSKSTTNTAQNHLRIKR